MRAENVQHPCHVLYTRRKRRTRRRNVGIARDTLQRTTFLSSGCGTLFAATAGLLQGHTGGRVAAKSCSSDDPSCESHGATYTPRHGQGKRSGMPARFRGARGCDGSAYLVVGQVDDQPGEDHRVLLVAAERVSLLAGRDQVHDHGEPRGGHVVLGVPVDRRNRWPGSAAAARVAGPRAGRHGPTVQQLPAGVCAFRKEVCRRRPLCACWLGAVVQICGDVGRKLAPRGKTKPQSKTPGKKSNNRHHHQGDNTSPARRTVPAPRRGGLRRRCSRGPLATGEQHGESEGRAIGGPPTGASPPDCDVDAPAATGGTGCCTARRRGTRARARAPRKKKRTLVEKEYEQTTWPLLALALSRDLRLFLLAAASATSPVALSFALSREGTPSFLPSQNEKRRGDLSCFILGATFCAPQTGPYLIVVRILRAGNPIVRDPSETNLVVMAVVVTRRKKKTPNF
ncbi:hypothetical protein HPB51_019778 [Rhipicephalus microplus]|uniref:Uncharacterized protein n=1 Tax=Rhipicephalus microplus TaxID=6941 RepID=A0A9J6DBD6_RHIMP|nr:hypothetical protein HPB51_019778 [Rhipicephalus microplus]